MISLNKSCHNNKNEVFYMSCKDNCITNKNIQCSVNCCANHSDSGNYCGLKEIHVAASAPNPQSCGGVDCKSFTAK